MIKIKTKKITPKKTKLKHQTRNIITIALTLIIVLSALSAVATYKEPITQTQKETTLSYSHLGKFDYIAYLKNNTVYNKTQLNPGEGKIFRKLTESLNGSFTYTFNCNQNTQINGQYRLSAQLQTDIWTKTYTLIPTTTIPNNNQATFTTTFPINYTHYEDIVTNINNETGVTAQDRTLNYIFDIYISAQTANETITDTFQPQISIPLGNDIINIDSELSQSENEQRQQTTKTQKPGSIDQSITLAAISTLFLIILILFNLFTESTLSNRELTLKEIKKIKKKYGEWIVETQQIPTTKNTETIQVNNLDDLVKLSEELGKPIIYTHTQDDTHIFYVLEDTIHYQYTLSKNGKIQKTVKCPECQTPVTIQGKPGEKIKLKCPKCGNTGETKI